jgi:biopolymer transport protein ExbB/TolQ|tara:strand:- start:393 stop:797 length:405 start_codon:yes stop_codon:yes gene_type:complete
MGMKLSLILGGLLFVTIAGSGWYINYLGDQISTLKGNQIVLETQIQEQNESIERYLEQQKNQQVQLNQLEAEKQEAMKDVNRLRKTFANHDLDKLALAKPGLMQSRINKASARVMATLEELTNPNQFDEKPITN